MRAWKINTAVPAARSEGLLIEPIGGETVVYDTHSKQAHCLKPLAAIVFDRSDGSTTVGEIATMAAERLGEAVSDADVADAVAQLEGVGLLQTVLIVRTGDHLNLSNGNGVSRREMIRRAGFVGAGAAVATSLITSVVPPSAFALSGIPAGCTGCSKNSDCISGHCCQSNAGKSCNQTCCATANNSCHITGCTCSIGGASCLTSNCGATEGNCICVCTVCASEETGGICPTCPSGSTSCCDNANDQPGCRAELTL
jgi:hypothetical protein